MTNIRRDWSIEMLLLEENWKQFSSQFAHFYARFVSCLLLNPRQQQRSKFQLMNKAKLYRTDFPIFAHDIGKSKVKIIECIHLQRKKIAISDWTQRISRMQTNFSIFDRSIDKEKKTRWFAIHISFRWTTNPQWRLFIMVAFIVKKQPPHLSSSSPFTFSSSRVWATSIDREMHFPLLGPFLFFVLWMKKQRRMENLSCTQLNRWKEHSVQKEISIEKNLAARRGKNYLKETMLKKHGRANERERGSEEKESKSERIFVSVCVCVFLFLLLLLFFVSEH